MTETVEEDTIVNVRLPALLARRLDRWVERERRKKKATVPRSHINRSSAIRDALGKMLEEA